MRCGVVQQQFEVTMMMFDQRAGARDFMAGYFSAGRRKQERKQEIEAAQVDLDR